MENKGRRPVSKFTISNELQVQVHIHNIVNLFNVQSIMAGADLGILVRGGCLKA